MSVAIPPLTSTIRLSWDDPATGEDREWSGRPPVTIGRSSACELTLNAEQVSRRHARLEFEGDALVLTDQGSSNGTFVNGARVGRATLADGDAFAVGPFTIAVKLPGRPPAASRAALSEVERAAASALRLRWREAGGVARAASLDGPLTIGRSAENAIVLAGEGVSRRHAAIADEGGVAILRDLGSANGTFLNGGRVTRAPLKPGDTIGVGSVRLVVEGAGAGAGPAADGGRDAATGSIPPEGEGEATIASPGARVLAPEVESGAIDGRTLFLDAAPDLLSLRSAPAFPPAIFQQPVVPIAALASVNLPVDEATYLAVGGGLGSFVWADHLRVYGVPAGQIVSIGLEEKPYGRYARLCRQSQIPEYERLRSNSDSCPDNLWGWPGYAVREVCRSLLRGDIPNAVKRTWQVFGEPTFAETYTPKSGDVFASIDREARRIGWDRIWRYGRVKAIRKTDDGRYIVAYSQSSPERPSVHRLMLARYVHLAVGYPGIRLLPDLQRYRERTQDFRTVVNAYEDHEQVYQDLLKRGGAVLVRGRGIVASRIIQRLYELRRQNPRIGVLHLMRTPLAQGSRFGRTQRRVANHWEFQPFNWPKSCWGGELRVQLERANEQERDMLLNDWGGTTTADRRDWARIVETGLREGWYQIRFGDVKGVERGADGKLVTTLAGKGVIQEETELKADYIIDCTGLEATVDAHPLLKDLVEHHGLRRSVKGRLRVANDFAVEGMENGAGRMYAAGAMTLGGPMAAVDSFLGLQYAALWSVHALVRARAPGLRRLHFLRSPWQWLRWAVGVAP